MVELDEKCAMDDETRRGTNTHLGYVLCPRPHTRYLMIAEGSKSNTRLIHLHNPTKAGI